MGNNAFFIHGKWVPNRMCCELLMKWKVSLTLIQRRQMLNVELYPALLLIIILYCSTANIILCITYMIRCMDDTNVILGHFWQILNKNVIYKKKTKPQACVPSKCQQCWMHLNWKNTKKLKPTSGANWNPESTTYSKPMQLHHNTKKLPQPLNNEEVIRKYAEQGWMNVWRNVCIRQPALEH